MSHKRNNSVKPRQMEHFVDTAKDKEEKIAKFLIKKREDDRQRMRQKYRDENPPDENLKQEALKDRIRLINTMDMARGMIDKKFKPKGQAQSLSPYLLANAVGFDSLKIINKLESDRQVRLDRKIKISEEIKRE